jgi:probable HAF family extracellular repeat protein
MVHQSSSARRPWLVLALIAGMGGPSSAGFTIRDLGVIVASGSSGAEAINGGGQAAGMATDARGNQVAVRSSGSGGFQAISLPSDAVSSLARSINLSNEVAGSYTDKDGVQHGFFSSTGQAEVFKPLTSQGTFTQANGINGSGHVVGSGDIGGGINRAFMASGGGAPSTIGPLGNALSSNWANGINDGGTVVGTSELSAGGRQHAFFTDSSGGATDLLTRNSAGSFFFNTFGQAIDNNGDIVGHGDLGPNEHAFFASSRGGALVDLGVLPGAVSSFADGVNNLARVVGSLDFGAGSSRAFLWDAQHGMVDLNTLISSADRSSWLLSGATGINDGNQISGEGYFHGVLHGFVLTPIEGQSIFTPADSVVPTPPALVLSAMGLGIASGWARLRRGRTGGRAAA